MTNFKSLGRSSLVALSLVTCQLLCSFLWVLGGKLLNATLRSDLQKEKEENEDLRKKLTEAERQNEAAEKNLLETKAFLEIVEKNFLKSDEDLHMVKNRLETFLAQKASSCVLDARRLLQLYAPALGWPMTCGDSVKLNSNIDAFGIFLVSSSASVTVTESILGLPLAGFAQEVLAAGQLKMTLHSNTTVLFECGKVVEEPQGPASGDGWLAFRACEYIATASCAYSVFVFTDDSQFERVKQHCDVNAYTGGRKDIFVFHVARDDDDLQTLKTKVERFFEKPLEVIPFGTNPSLQAIMFTSNEVVQIHLFMTYAELSAGRPIAGKYFDFYLMLQRRDVAILSHVLELAVTKSQDMFSVLPLVGLRPKAKLVEGNGGFHFNVSHPATPSTQPFTLLPCRILLNKEQRTYCIDISAPNLHFDEATHADTVQLSEQKVNFVNGTRLVVTCVLRFIDEPPKKGTVEPWFDGTWKSGSPPLVIAGPTKGSGPFSSPAAVRDVMMWAPWGTQPEQRFVLQTAINDWNKMPPQLSYQRGVLRIELGIRSF